MHPAAIAAACVCNIMWTIDDFTAENGAAIVVPGSHLFGREPDHRGGSGGELHRARRRVRRSTGENRTDRPRIGLTTNF